MDRKEKKLMTKTKRRLLVSMAIILAACLIFVALIYLFGGGFGAKYETVNHDITERVDGISIDVSTADVTVALSEDGEIRVECFERKCLAYDVTVEGGTLKISEIDTRKWYDYLSISFVSPKITVYLPEGEYGDLRVDASTADIDICADLTFDSIGVNVSTGDITCSASAYENASFETSTGDITVSGITAESLELTASTGDITLRSVSVRGGVSVEVSTGDTEIVDLDCGKFSADASTGDVTLTRTVTNGTLSVTCTTGDVTLASCDGGEIVIETSTGSVRGSLKTAKMFIAQASTGSINVPDTASGGVCRITTTTGNINITVE
jgi:DUF4097 and DUF4098 domain-containing protein YvlB